MAPKKKKAAAEGAALEAKTRTTSKGKGKNNAANAAAEEVAIEKEGAMEESQDSTTEAAVVPPTENTPEPVEVVVTVATDELKSEAVAQEPTKGGENDNSAASASSAIGEVEESLQVQSSESTTKRVSPIKKFQSFFNKNIATPFISLLPDRYSLVERIDSEARLENELWPGYNASAANFERTFLIMLVISERCKAGVVLAPFDALTKESKNNDQLSAESKCEIFFQNVATMALDDSLTEKPYLLEPYAHFLICAFRNLEDIVVKKTMLRYLSLPIWESLSEPRLTAELQKHPQVAKFWKGYTSKLKACEKAATTTAEEPVKSSSPAPVAKKQKKAGKGSKKAAENVEGAMEVVVTSEVSRKAPEEASKNIIDTMRRDAALIPTLLRQFLDYLSAYDENEASQKPLMVYFERFLELLVDLLSQVPTRKFLRTVLDDMHFLLVCKYFIHSKSDLLGKNELLVRLLSSVENYMFFEFDDQSGQALSSQKILEDSNVRNQRLQQIAYSDFSGVLQDLVFSSVGELNKREALCKHLDNLDDDQLRSLAGKLHILTEKDTLTSTAEVFHSREMVYELFVERFVARPRQLNELNMLSLYPTEDLLWDSNQIPRSEGFSGNEVLALPKLNLQFLTVSDYLLRNFLLFRLESAYQIREDLADAIKRMGPKQQQLMSTTSGSPKVTFSGWARMALPITSTSIDEVSKPRLGEVVPAHVDCTVTIDLSRFTGEIRHEWEDLKNHDVVFLVCIENPQPHATAILAEFDRERKLMAAGKKPKRNRDFEWSEESLDFPSLFGIKYVRGGEIFELRDEENIVLNDLSRPDERKSGRSGNKRKLRLRLDPAQYYNDIKEGHNCYETMNLLVRRRPKENNFKATLETIRDLMNAGGNTYSAIPNWLHDVFLGFGNPKATSFISGEKVKELDYRDTFLDPIHVIESFPAAASIVFETSDGKNIPVVTDNKAKPLSEEEKVLLPSPPYRLTLTEDKEDPSSGLKRKSDSAASGQVSTMKVRVQGHRYVNPGPYPEDKPPTNTVRFTPTQINAIRSATSEGLTMIVGPPGTGKTDVAVQVIANLYHTHQTEKILIVTHSNAALNDLFEKIMTRDVAPRHLLRLGTGEAELRREAGAGTALAEGEVFSKQGRVNWSLTRRIKLLSAVSKLGASLGNSKRIVGDVGSSCETAEYFFLEQIQSRLEKFYIDVRALTEGEKFKQFSCFNIQQLFPFNKYFNDTPAPLFTGDWAADLESAEGCFNHIRNIFSEISDYRAFEVLRSQSLRSDYLLTKQARIVAMTCTHAAMTRRRLIELGFKYDSIIMEESAQILEVESLIPMLLQDCDPVDRRSRLKRVVLLGDHQQLPPVVKHSALRQFSHLDQSLFTRFVRLGVPSVLLDRQGRARPEIAALYSWKYKMVSNTGEVQTLGDLPIVRDSDDFLRSNAGFLWTHQLIDVPNFQGKGESCPTPYFFQNLGEAEYVVAVYQYMRLLGYPASKISILTTYNGQKSLIRDILAQRCKKSDLFGLPASVSTVDQYQGQQNDYILLSLVRTQSVGHLQDVRRLIVALSRARLGLYVFCRQSVFQGHRELAPALSKLVHNGSGGKKEGELRSTLELVAQEFYPTSRGVHASPPPESVTMEGVTAMGQLVYELAKRAKPF